jgi:hypothetical protein
MLVGTLETFGHVLNFNGQSSKMVDILCMNWISLIQPHASVMYLVDQKLGTPHKFSSGAKNWQILRFMMVELNRLMIWGFVTN